MIIDYNTSCTTTSISILLNSNMSLVLMQSRSFWDSICNSIIIDCSCCFDLISGRLENQIVRGPNDIVLLLFSVLKFILNDMFGHPTFVLSSYYDYDKTLLKLGTLISECIQVSPHVLPISA